jgi:O-antigen/teichoic acid export membrane protein
VVFFIHLDFGLHGIFGALLLSHFARVLSGMAMTSRKFFKPQPSWNLSLCLYVLKEAYPIGINRILRKTSFRIDTVLIKMMRTASEVGIFHGAYRIILVLTLIPQSINQALFPMISRLAVESQNSLSQLLERIVKILLIMVIPLVASLILLSEDVILLVLGESFRTATSALMVLSLVWGIMFFNDLFVRSLNASNRQSLGTKAVAVCLVVNVIADIFLIYAFGYFGAVIATLLGEMSLFLGAYYFVSRNVAKISWGKVVLKPLFAGIVMAAVMFGLNPISRVLALLVGTATFFLGIILSKSLDQEEMKIIRENLLKIRHGLDYSTAR